MKIVIVGATGTIGSAVVSALESKHELVKVGKTKGDVNLDITDVDSIRSALQQIGSFDALIVASGDLAFNSLSEMSAQEWNVGINSKLMGQINLAREALEYLTPGGSITLTSGILSKDPIAGGVAATTINGALEHFVKAAATEMPKGIRINVVSPTVLEESLPMYGDFFPGFIPVPGKTVAQAYVRSTLGVASGETFVVE
ncbi:short chain dehydrogenase [Hahella sp. CCB-MM4]|uniref:short chain dehydrogenase n=1 Tax=Hahella sp. (strain CCB-MM4) TaxID=1926491 RepID=UPI000B9B58A5|nr:short chain dehydrogenase [Hahella sp. CCB-MM4]